MCDQALQAGPLAKNFNPAEAEARWYEFWESRHLFTADPDQGGPPFVIVIPPPNITGNLHMGHALDNTLQDVLIRYHRMLGDNTLWMPGTDHAGIATQNVVERALAAEGSSREALGREKFVERVWRWKAEYGGNIGRQLRRLGASCDWSRERFTMDEGLSKAVREVFVSLYEQGLIYQGDYIINWCPRCLTALADLEVEHEEKKHHLYYVRYRLAGREGWLTVATTRPETIFGDTAVAVNPADPRFREYIGARVEVPLTGRTVPVIGDGYVDMDFGAGALKVTPAHDPNDFLIGQRHDLPVLKALDDRGVMTAEAGKYQGLDRFEARAALLEELAEAGLLEKTEPLVHSVGVCYRCKTVVEPNLSRQWFVRTAPLAARAAQAVRDGETSFVPRTWEKTYFEWLDNIRDWCISRQLWWGHQIPAWYCQGCGETIVSREDPERCPQCGSGQLRRDPDVLDTWFSSALWPFSTLGWPEKTKELAAYYPTTMLVTGFDIIFFWVARMMMMGLHFMKAVPFRTVAIHALIRDASGQKMSKSKGNVIDPLGLIDRYGADAFRFTLTALAGHHRDIKLSDDRVAGYSRFVNKLWNAAKFTLMNVGPARLDLTAPLEPENAADRWILSRLGRAVAQARENLAGLHFDHLAGGIYHFIWDEFCDWYLELIKPILYGPEGPAREKTQRVLLFALGAVCRLLHPVMPFVTEELWSKLPGAEGSIMKAPYPDPLEANLKTDPAAEAEIGFLMEVVTAVRQVRADFSVPPATRLSPLVKVEAPALRAILKEYNPLLLKLFNGEHLGLAEPGAGPPPQAALTAQTWGEVWTPLAGLIDPAAEAGRLAKERLKLEGELKAARAKLDNADYVRKAPPEIVAETEERLKGAQARRDRLNRALLTLEAMNRQ